MPPRKRRIRYPVVKSGQWVSPVMKGYKMQCCDCGLIHVLDFAVHDDGKGISLRARRLGERWPR